MGGGGVLGGLLNLFGLQDQKAPEVEQPAQQATASESSAPTEADPSVALAAEEERRRRRSQSGGSSSILTGGLGASGTATTQKKTLLG